MDADGRRWTQMDADGRRWTQMDADGRRWTQMDADDSMVARGWDTSQFILTASTIGLRGRFMRAVSRT